MKKGLYTFGACAVLYALGSCGMDGQAFSVCRVGGRDGWDEEADRMCPGVSK